MSINARSDMLGDILEHLPERGIPAVTEFVKTSDSWYELLYSLNDLVRACVPNQFTDKDKIFPGILTMYEAFQLYEIHLRLNRWVDRSIPGSNIIPYINMALMSKLFEEDGMYEAFCESARNNEKAALIDDAKHARAQRGTIQEYTLKYDMNHYLYNIEPALRGDRAMLELFAEKRSKIRGAARQNAFNYHITAFPWEFNFERELLNIMDGAENKWAKQKDISPEVCDLMVAAEVRYDELC